MGVPVTGTITTYPDGIYPTIDPITGIDGWRSVADHTARNAIVSGTPLRLRQGMAVWTQNDSLLWILNAAPWAGTDGDWTQFAGGGGTITLSGDATGTGTSAITVTVSSYNGGTTFGSMAHQGSGAVAITGGTITGIPDPVNPLDVANKEYVDTLAAGLTFVPPGCRLATAAALTGTYANGTLGVGATLTNSTTQAAIVIDGVTPSVADRVLVKNQAAPAQNGIYTVTTVGTGATNWVLTRATNYDQAAECVSGSYTAIGSGTANVGTLWIMTAASVGTMGTDPIVFTPLVTTGSGTVTTVSVVTANGLAGTVANPFSTPAITLSTTVTGILKGNGTAISAATAGTDYLVANQTITLTGDVAGSGATSISTTIAAAAVTYAKIQNVTAVSLLGNPTGGAATVSEITLGAGLHFSGTTIVSTGSGGTITSLTGDVTGSGTGAVATTLATVNANVGSFGSSTAIPTLTVNGKGLVTAASTNVVIAPAGTLTGTVLAANVVTSSLTTVGTIGTGVWQGTPIATAFIANAAVTYAKIQNVAAVSLLGNPTGSPAAPSEITLGANLSFSGTTLVASGGGGSGTINTGTTPMLAYYATTGTTLSPIALSALIDDITSTTNQGCVLVRGPSSWVALQPSTAGQVLQTNGAAQNPSWGFISYRPFTAILGRGAAIVTGTNSTGDYAICPYGGTFLRWDIAIPIANQPSGASLVIDVLKSSDQGSTWTSLWATNTGNRPTVVSGSNSGGSATAFDTTTYSPGDWLRYDVITAGGGAVQNVSLVISSHMNQ